MEDFIISTLFLVLKWERKKIKVNFAEAEAHEQKKGDQAIFHA